jgi:hypothetical protein
MIGSDATIITPIWVFSFPVGSVTHLSISPQPECFAVSTPALAGALLYAR